jgi:hypothetical protein
MKAGDTVTVYLQERRWMSIPFPLVETDKGAAWGPEGGIPFLTVTVEGRPVLQPHVPDANSGVDC